MGENQGGSIMQKAARIAQARAPDDAFEDHGIIAHRATDESTLAREGRRGACVHKCSTALAKPVRV